MARRGVKRSGSGDYGEDDPLLCPYEGCHYRAKSLHGLGVHKGMAKHCGPLKKSKKASENSEDFSSSASDSAASHASGSRDGSSDAISDNSHTYMSGDEVPGADSIQPEEEQIAVQSQHSSHGSEGSHAPSETPSTAHGMDIPIANADADPEQSSKDSALSSCSANSNEVQHQQGVAGLAAAASASALTEADKRLHDALLGLPLQRQQQIIDLVRDPTVDLSTVTATSARRLRKDMRALSKQEWKEVEIAKCENKFEVVLHYRKDVLALLQELLSHPAVKPSHFRPRALDKYEEARDGEWFSDAWEFVQEEHPEAEGVLPVVFYSDETHVSRNRNIHVLLVFVALPLHIMRAEGGLFRYLAFIPSFKPRDVGLPDKSQQRLFQVFKRKVKLVSVDIALEALKGLSYRCVTFRVGKDQTPMRLVPLPCNYVADGLEAGMMLNIKAYPALHCDINTNLERSRFDDPDAVGEARTEEKMSRVLRRVIKLNRRGTAADKRAAKRLMDKWSLQDTDESPLAGFANTDCYQLICPDTLHQSAKGDVEKLLDLLTDTLSEPVLASINKRLASVPAFPGFHPPSQGLSTPKMWATQQAAMFACLPVALLHLEGDFLAAMRIVIMAYLEFTAVRDLDSHTAQTLAQLDDKCRRFQVLAVDLLGEYRPGGFTYPKFHANRKYADLIRSKGCVGLASAGYGESTHKIIKKAWQLSNKKSAGLERQICEYTSQAQQQPRVEGAEDAVARSAGQRAVQNGRRELIASSRTLVITELTANGRAGDWLTQRPELKHLADSLQRAMPEGERPQDGTVQVHPGVALPLQLHRKGQLEAVILRALPQFGASKRQAYSFVSVRAGDEQDEHWFAQLRLVLSFRDAAGAEHRLAYVRWLSSTGGAELPMQRLTWAKQGPAGCPPQHPWYECVDVDSIERPVFLQPDPGHEGCFYFNHFMGSMLS